MTEPPVDPALFEENERLAPEKAERLHFDAGELTCERGETLPGVTVAYETWGTLNSAADNAIVVCHALSGDSHAIGWWDRIVGPGRAIDTEKYFVIGTNALGGCQGTTGPSSIGEDGQPYGSRFPHVTVGDMVTVQRRLTDHLGVRGIALVAGGSMGGMQALEWGRQAPDVVRRVWMTASCAAHSAMQIGFNEAGRQAIQRDPHWRGGDYALAEPPTQGLAVARMIGHLSYLSEHSFTAKFGRDRRDDTGQFQVESYLAHQADKFVRRFDANSYIVLSRAIDDYDGREWHRSEVRYLFTSYTSDWLYPTSQSLEMLQLARAAGCAAWHDEIDLPFGHDSFLLDGEFQAASVRRFLADSMP